MPRSRVKRREIMAVNAAKQALRARSAVRGADRKKLNAAQQLARETGNRKNGHPYPWEQACALRNMLRLANGIRDPKRESAQS
jgi:hypothetical protein